MAQLNEKASHMCAHFIPVLERAALASWTAVVQPVPLTFSFDLKVIPIDQ